MHSLTKPIVSSPRGSWLARMGGTVLASAALITASEIHSTNSGSAFETGKAPAMEKAFQTRMAIEKLSPEVRAQVAEILKGSTNGVDSLLLQFALHHGAVQALQNGEKK